MPTGTSSPAPRSTRAKPTAKRSTSTVAGIGVTARSRGPHEVADAVRLHPLRILSVLEHGAERRPHRAFVEGGASERGERHRPVDRLRDARAACTARARAPTRRRPPPDEPRSRTPRARAAARSRPRARSPDGRPSGRGSGASSASCTSRVRFDVITTSGGTCGAERAELGHRDRVVRQHLEQEGLELVVGAVDLVDQEDRRRPLAVVDRLQQRPPHQEALGVELVFERVGGCVRADLARGLGRAQVQQLAGVVPLVHGLRDVEALVALQAQQLAPGPAGEHLGHLGLADSRFAFEQQRPVQRLREEDRRREALIGQVVVRGERIAHIVDGLGRVLRRCSHHLQRRLSATFRGNGGGSDGPRLERQAGGRRGCVDGSRLRVCRGARRRRRSRRDLRPRQGPHRRGRGQDRPERDAPRRGCLDDRRCDRVRRGRAGSARRARRPRDERRRTSARRLRLDSPRRVRRPRSS